MTLPSNLDIAGWKTLEKLGFQQEKLIDDIAVRQAESAALFVAVFGTPEGQRVLEILKSNTLGRSPLPAHVGAQAPITLEQCVPFTIFRMGQNAVVEEIIRIIETAKRPPPKKRGK